MSNRPLRTLLLAGTVAVMGVAVPVLPAAAAPPADPAPAHVVLDRPDGSGDWLKEWLCAKVRAC